MKKLENKELKEITGGIGIGWIIGGIAAGLTFIIGVISGYTNPNKCNN